MSHHRLSPSLKGDYHLLIGPYDLLLVEWIRTEIPDHARQWDPTVRAWRIQNDYVDKVQARINK